MTRTIKKQVASVALLALIAAACGRNPEWVDVKYRDTPVHVGTPQFDRLPNPNSSLVKDAWYDTNYQYLVINLRGTNYQYCAFPRNAWNELRNADSLGHYYSTNIKSHYDCREVGTIPTYNE